MKITREQLRELNKNGKIEVECKAHTNYFDIIEVEEK